jgi:hypothetical protein
LIIYREIQGLKEVRGEGRVKKCRKTYPLIHVNPLYNYVFIKTTEIGERE